MITARKAGLEDLDFMVYIDIKVDGLTSPAGTNLSPEEAIELKTKIMNFIVDDDKGAILLEDSDNNEKIGLIMYSIVNRDIMNKWNTAIGDLDRSLFQSDGRYLEIFQLWVHPDYRRQGLAAQLKRKVEEEAHYHEVNLIYTHTEESNVHVIELNKKLGYQVVRRGTTWDSVIRVSLIKHLN